MGLPLLKMVSLQASSRQQIQASIKTMYDRHISEMIRLAGKVKPLYMVKDKLRHEMRSKTYFGCGSYILDLCGARWSLYQTFHIGVSNVQYDWVLKLNHAFFLAAMINNSA